jgi:hypothetical protein
MSAPLDPRHRLHQLLKGLRFHRRAVRSGCPPAVTLGSKATTVAADGGLLKATFQSGGTINNTAINRPIRLDPSEFTLKPRL